MPYACLLSHKWTCYPNHWQTILHLLLLFVICQWLQAWSTVLRCVQLVEICYGKLLNLLHFHCFLKCPLAQTPTSTTRDTRNSGLIHSMNSVLAFLTRKMKIIAIPGPKSSRQLFKDRDLLLRTSQLWGWITRWPTLSIHSTSWRFRKITPKTRIFIKEMWSLQNMKSLSSTCFLQMLEALGIIMATVSVDSKGCVTPWGKKVSTSITSTRHRI